MALAHQEDKQMEDDGVAEGGHPGYSVGEDESTLQGGSEHPHIPTGHRSDLAL